MKIFIAAYYEFIKNLRDIKMLSILVVFPLLTIYILGNVIGAYLSEDSSKVIQVGYINHDDGLIGGNFNTFLESNEIKDRLKINQYSNIDNGTKALDEGSVNVLIYLPTGLSKNILAGDSQTIEVFGNRDTEFVESLVNSFISTYNAVNAVLMTGGKVAEPTRESSIERIYYTRNTVMPNAIDYYSVLTLLQMLIMGAVLGIFIITKSYGSDIHIRIHTLPVNPVKLIIGRILGSVAYLFLTAVVIIIFTKIVYKANWDGNMLVILGTLLMFCSIAVGLGIIIGITIPGFSSGLMIVFLLMLFFAVTSGAISPSSTIDALTNTVPNHHAKLIIFGSIYGYSNKVILQAVCWLTGMLAAVYGVVIIFVRRVKYDRI